MIGELVVMAMTIHPGDWIHVDADGVADERHSLDEPWLVVERPVCDSHMDNVGQIDAAQKPDRREVQQPYGHAEPGAERRRREVRRSRCMQKDDCVTDQRVCFQDDRAARLNGAKSWAKKPGGTVSSSRP